MESIPTQLRPAMTMAFNRLDIWEVFIVFFVFVLPEVYITHAAHAQICVPWKKCNVKPAACFLKCMHPSVLSGSTRTTEINCFVRQLRVQLGKNIFSQPWLNRNPWSRCGNPSLDVRRLIDKNKKPLQGIAYLHNEKVRKNLSQSALIYPN